MNWAFLMEIVYLIPKFRKYKIKVFYKMRFVNIETLFEIFNPKSNTIAMSLPYI